MAILINSFRSDFRNGFNESSLKSGAELEIRLRGLGSSVTTKHPDLKRNLLKSLLRTACSLERSEAL